MTVAQQMPRQTQLPFEIRLAPTLPPRRRVQLEPVSRLHPAEPRTQTRLEAAAPQPIQTERLPGITMQLMQTVGGMALFGAFLVAAAYL